MLAKSDVEKWLDDYGKAWVKGDPEMIISLFSEDAIYQEMPFDEPMQGKGAIQAYWQEGAADAQKDVTFNFKLWAVTDSEAFARWQASFTRITSGVRVELDGTFRLVFATNSQDLKCAELQEWWHRQEHTPTE